MSRSLGSVMLLAATCVQANDKVEEIETLVIEGRSVRLIGDAISSSEGVIGQGEIALRPTLRTGEVLEAVPGMVVTQHSGTGKANQYFLRGFNLDHGTDFASYIDGMPINMRSHGHGQGYTDLNFIIPETLSKLVYSKGSYNPKIADFNGAGSAQMFTANKVKQGNVQLTLGEDNYIRALLIDSVELNSGDLLMALERNTYDGPWQNIKEDLSKTNGLVKYTEQLDQGYYSVTLMAYDNSWNSADQIPHRAVTQGLISELGSIDTSLGGNSSRYSVNVDWQNGPWQARAYAIDYTLNLWSNFTYFADNNDRGDQFEQVDDRKIYGGDLSYKTANTWFDYSVDNEFGLDFRFDDIAEVGLYQTAQRLRYGTVRRDNIEQYSVGAYWQNTLHWSDSLRSVIAARYDYFDFKVRDAAGINVNQVNLAVNGGNDDEGKLSIKSNLIYTINDNWEWYASYGQGIHSNDARGTTIKVDPADGTSVNAVDPIVRTLGYETGVRLFITNQVNASLSLWSLELDSELLFVGDAGNTEATRPSSRQGVELSTYYHLSPEWTLDFEYSYSDAEFDDKAAEGRLIPGAIKTVVQAGLSYESQDNWYGSLRARHFGKRPLIEDGSVYSNSSTVWNARLGYQFDNWTVFADLLNVFNSDAHDIDYFYESQLAGESAPVEDLHYHVIEPRTLRVSLNYAF